MTETIQRTQAIRSMGVAAVVAGSLLVALAPGASAGQQLGDTTASVSSKSTVAASKDRGKGSAHLRIAVESFDLDSGFRDLGKVLERPHARGTLRQRGRVVRHVSIPVRFPDTFPCCSAPTWRGRTTVRSLPTGRYQVRLTGITSRTTVPGGRVTLKVYPFKMDATSYKSPPLRIHPHRTQAWRAGYGSDSFAWLQTGTAVDPQGQPLAGLPVCSVAVRRFDTQRDCGRSRSDGSFVRRLQAYSDVFASLPALLLGDPLQDLAWQSVEFRPLEERIESDTFTLRPRGVMTGTLTGPDGQGVADQTVCAAPVAHWGWYWEQAWCRRSGADGRYELPVEGGEQTFLPGSVATRGYIDLMDAALDSADPRLEVRFDLNVTESSAQYPSFAHGFTPAPYTDRTAHPGRSWDIALTDLVAGEPVRITGQVLPASGSQRGVEVCGNTRAGWACTGVDEAGHYSLSLPTRVLPGAPQAEVAVKLIGGSWADYEGDVVSRFTVMPGSTTVKDLSRGQ